jgi:hypothetical protein
MKSHAYPRCQDTIEIRDLLGLNPIAIQCQREIVNAAGRHVGHIHHHCEYEVAGCEQARVSWTRRP